jgi:hypothetical protein
MPDTVAIMLDMPINTPNILMYSEKKYFLSNKMLHFTRVVAGDVDVVGENAGKHGAEEAGGHDHENDDGYGVAARQADPNQATGRNHRS